MKPKTMDQIEQALKNWGVDGLYHWDVEWLIDEAKDNFADGLVKGSSIGDNTARNALKERDADMARWQKDRIELTKENATLINDRNEVFKLWDMHKYRLDIAVKALESLENDTFEEGYFDVAREALKKIREE